MLSTEEIKVLLCVASSFEDANHIWLMDDRQVWEESYNNLPLQFAPLEYRFYMQSKHIINRSVRLSRLCKFFEKNTVRLVGIQAEWTLAVELAELVDPKYYLTALECPDLPNHHRVDIENRLHLYKLSQSSIARRIANSSTISDTPFISTELSWAAKPIKVYMTCGWTNDATLYKNWIDLFSDSHKYIVPTTDLEEADWVLIGNFANVDLKGKHTILARMENNMGAHPEWWGEWANPKAEHLWHFCSQPDWNGELSSIRRNAMEIHIKPSNYIHRTKSDVRGSGTELCKYHTAGYILTAVVSERYTTVGQRYRVDLLKLLEKRWKHDPNFEVRIWGRGNEHGFKNYYGELPVWRKEDAIGSYIYHLAVENTKFNGYATEKVADGIVFGCTVFYWGDPTVEFDVVHLPDNLESAASLIEQTMLRGETLPDQSEKLFSKVSLIARVNRLAKNVVSIPVMTAYTINLDRRPDRWESFTTTWDLLGLSHSNVKLVRQPAVDGRSLQIGDPRLTRFVGNRFYNSSAMYGCSLSHIAVWERFLASNEPYCLVFEDDNTFVPEFTYLLSKLMKSVSKLQPGIACLLGYSRHGIQTDFSSPKLSMLLHRYPSINNLDNDDFIGGAFAYLLDRKAAQTFVDASVKVNRGIDIWYKFEAEAFGGLSYVEPALCKSKVVFNNMGDTDIQRADIPMIDPRPVCYIHKFIGGLGNQLFQYFSVVAMAKKYDRIPVMRAQKTALGYVDSIVYNQVFNLPVIEVELTHVRHYSYDNAQFEPIVELTPYSHESLRIHGMAMNIVNFIDIIPFGMKMLGIATKRKPNTCLLAFRSFNQELRPDWQINSSYYKDAIDAMRSFIPDVTFIAYTDDLEYARAICEENGVVAEINVGKRDGVTDVEHFYRMFECTHAILIESSYHIWSAILNTDPDHFVVIPNNSKWLHRTGIDMIEGTIIKVDI